MRELCCENVVGFWIFAAFYQIQDLEEKFLDFVAYHYNQVQKTEEFFELTPENIQTVLERNDINADEKTIFQSLMNWIYYKKDSRQEYLPNLLQCVRLGSVGADFFKEHVQQNSMIEDRCKMQRQQEPQHFVSSSVGAYFTDPRLNKPDFAKPRLTEDAILVIGRWANQEACNYIESFDFRANKWCASTMKDPLGPKGYLGAAVMEPSSTC